MGTKHSIGDCLHSFSAPFKAMGCHFGNRMTVIKRSDGTLWVHSPLSVTDELIDELNTMGHISDVIAPNLFHHCHLQSFIHTFPNTQLYGVQGIEKKVKNLTFTSLESSCEKKQWAPDIESCCIEGMPQVNEHVFFHSASKTLIVTDLIFNISNQTGLSKLLFTINGIHNRLATSRLYKSLIKDKQAFSASIERLFRWDFENVILAHGDILIGNGKRALTRTFEWALSP